ncbi:DNA polymerase III subunit gamma/tau [Caldanaerobius polysaccharolyticus]|uniref:DNA polymerase III subunit gamma/tau n=1 Tax=Caldanaerobius polysaccharolyticus TaxID=44256 RepID=UPI00047BF939|nr:DNA polymerase III subunit gamma/tau [Caldanaerobius polysaccharolyticus]
MYTALYRKFRPGNFSQVVGQEHVVRTLKNQIITGSLSHAYLFCGTRGTGKTSVARIFAKAVNCSDSVDGDPCGVCDNCKAIDEGTFMDVYEIDAASNNSVDNIRDLRDNVIYPPAMGRYKLYIIDEVHMLSTSAFNAFLKTLEEPPAHAIFILATTDPQKIPATILSRCQRFDFRRISDQDMIAHLKSIAGKVKVKIDDMALRLIVSKADGAVRDALSLLDKCISYCGDVVTHDDALEVLGVLDDEVLLRFSKAVLNYDTAEALRIVDGFYALGRDAVQLLDEVIRHYRNLLMARISGEGTEEYASYLKDEIKEQVKSYSENRLIRCIQILNECANQVKWAALPRVMLEIAIVRLCQPEADDDIAGILDRIEKLEQRGVKIDHAAVPSAISQSEPQREVSKREPQSVETFDNGCDVKRVWPLLLEEVKREKMALYVFLKNAVPRYENGVLVVEVDKPIFRDALRKAENVAFIEDLIKKICGSEMMFRPEVKKIGEIQDVEKKNGE